MKKLQKWLTLCLVFLLLWPGSACVAQESQSVPEPDKLIYGYSEQGRELVCYAVGHDEAPLSLLMVFGLHGFEDVFDRDAEVLALIAEKVIAHYAVQADALPFRLYVIPTANPDGLLEGTSQDGFGRCNANGIDINRDFPVGWTQKTTSRIKTGKEPFATAEARAIRDLVETIQPTYGMDVHGWAELSLGDGEMAEYFAEPFDLKLRQLPRAGMLCAWLNTQTKESMLLELPADPNKEAYVTQTAGKLISGIDTWMARCMSGQ